MGTMRSHKAACHASVISWPRPGAPPQKTPCGTSAWRKGREAEQEQEQQVVTWRCIRRRPNIPQGRGAPGGYGNMLSKEQEHSVVPGIVGRRRGWCKTENKVVRQQAVKGHVEYRKGLKE